MDLGDTLATDAAQEIVQVLFSGLIEVVKKIPSLWRRAGKHRQDLIRAEIERSSLALQHAGNDLPAVQARQEGVWEGRLRDLLAEDPDAAAELRGMLDEIRSVSSQMPQITQHNTASAPSATVYGVILGNIINHSDPPRLNVPTALSGTDSAGQEEEDRA